MKQQPSSKDIVTYYIQTFNVQSVNWPLQMRLAKTLLKKYNYNEIKYAIDYYKGKGMEVVSLGFLTYKTNMKDPVSLYHAEANVIEGGDSGDRNWTRIAKNSKAQYGAEYPVDLFEKSNQDN